MIRKANSIFVLFRKYSNILQISFSCRPSNISSMANFFLACETSETVLTAKTTQPRPQVFSVKGSITDNFIASFQLLY